MKIGIVSDHGGYELKEEIKDSLKDKYEIIDYGTNSEEKVDYPLYAFKLGEGLLNKEVSKGIAICTTGTGMSIALNKMPKIIAAKVDNKEEASLASLHNHANCITFGNNHTKESATEMVETFLTTAPSNEERHLRRVQEILDYEENHD